MQFHSDILFNVTKDKTCQRNAGFGFPLVLACVYSTDASKQREKQVDAASPLLLFHLDVLKVSL